MWQRFTERARRSILLAQEEAKTLNHGQVGSEHLLLGLLREDAGVAALVLHQLSVELDKVRAVITAPSPDALNHEPQLTVEAKRALEVAADEARRMSLNDIDTEHLLLALTHDKSTVLTILENLGTNSDEIRSKVALYLSSEDHRGVAEYEVVDSSRIPLTINQPSAGKLLEAWLGLPLALPVLGILLQAAEECERIGGREIELEHLLLALGREEHGDEIRRS